MKIGATVYKKALVIFYRAFFNPNLNPDQMILSALSFIAGTIAVAMTMKDKNGNGPLPD